MNTFANAVSDDLDNEMTTTTNGMAARKTTASKVLDFFGEAGSARGVDLTTRFGAALADEEELAVRALLWVRDIRGGAGERATFRKLLAYLDKTNPALAGRIMHKVPELGRWDDLFVYTDAVNRIAALELFCAALYAGNGLAFKWAPREKSARSAEARELRNALGMTPKQYRKFLAANTNVVETQMCAKEWDAIDFSKIPSMASARYQKAFGRNAAESYSKYLRELQKPQSERDPKVKINAGAIHPHDIVKSVSKGNAAVANEQWAALPNYVGNAKILPMVDTSGSMGSLRYNYKSGNVQPIEVALALGLYLSEKNTSEFKDLFLTFSAKPKFQKTNGTLEQRLNQMQRADWEMNTNISAAFDEILRVAKKGNVSQADMPDTLLILSDMQFDVATSSGWGNRLSPWNVTAVETARLNFTRAGYELPKLVFWNLRSGYDNTPVKFDEAGTALVSGFSPAIMKEVLGDDLENYTPYNVMVKTLMSERYAY